MLWRKAWVDTRWRFYIGMAVLIGFVFLVVLTEPWMVENLTIAPDDPRYEVFRWQTETVSTYRGYVWLQWFFKVLPTWWVIFAVLMGVGGMVTDASRGAVLFTLSLPVTRRRLLGVSVATGAIKLMLLAIVPSLLISALSLVRGKVYPVTDTLAHSLLIVSSGFVFFIFSVMLTVIFESWWPAIIVAIAVLQFPLTGLKVVNPGVLPFLSGESYFRDGSFPWPSVFISLAISAAIYFLSVRILERKDF